MSLLAQLNRARLFSQWATSLHTSLPRSTQQEYTGVERFVRREDIRSVRLSDVSYAPVSPNLFPESVERLRTKRPEFTDSSWIYSIFGMTSYFVLHVEDLLAAGRNYMHSLTLFHPRKCWSEAEYIRHFTVTWSKQPIKKCFTFLKQKSCAIYWQ